MIFIPGGPRQLVKSPGIICDSLCSYVKCCGSIGVTKFGGGDVMPEATAWDGLKEVAVPFRNGQFTWFMKYSLAVCPAGDQKATAPLANFGQSRQHLSLASIIKTRL
jgi:hypothetical protein